MTRLFSNFEGGRGMNFPGKNMASNASFPATPHVNYIQPSASIRAAQRRALKPRDRFFDRPGTDRVPARRPFDPALRPVAIDSGPSLRTPSPRAAREEVSHTVT